MILFGTGGIRGIMKPGEFDEAMVARASEAVSRWMKDEGGKSVVIAYDTRRNSRKFAQITASVFSSNNINAFIFDRPIPTPLLSFAVRYLKADAGIVITASHNPPEYNGYKVYTSSGAQALPDVTEKISTHLSKITQVPPFGNSCKHNIVPDEVIDRYIESVVNLMEEYGVKEGIELAYSPLHGTGYGVVDTILNKLGVSVRTVREQTSWDGTFATTKSPNPEDDEALHLLVTKMREENISYGIATDPDADRVGFVLMEQGEITRLTGNQVGVLLSDLSMEKRRLENPYLVKTIVSTDMVVPMCEEHNVELLQTPTGFKYIGDLIHRRETQGNKGFLFAFEESCGYLAGDFVKDKDAVIGSCLIASLISQGSVLERLEGLYRKYGYYMERLINISFESPVVARQIYERLQKNPPESVGHLKLKEFRDYSQESGDVIPNETLLLITETGKIFIRPSGTEPKLKLYLMTKADSQENARELMDLLKKASDDLLTSLTDH